MATLWRLAQDYRDPSTGVLICAAGDLRCAGQGAARFGGRWNGLGTSVVYLAESIALAQLEKRVHSPVRPPAATVLIELTLPDAVLRRAASVPALPKGWAAMHADWAIADAQTQQVGDEWARSLGSLLLAVPSVVVQREHNYLLSPLHPDLRKVKTKRHAYAPDPRLW